MLGGFLAERNSSFETLTVSFQGYVQSCVTHNLLIRLKNVSIFSMLQSNKIPGKHIYAKDETMSVCSPYTTSIWGFNLSREGNSGRISLRLEMIA